MAAQTLRFLTIALIAGAGASRCAYADVILATDDASQTAYDDGWQMTDNGGSGYPAWSAIGTSSSGSGSQGVFMSSNSAANHIPTGAQNEAFGFFANGGGVSHAVRSFSSALVVNNKFTIDMDNGSINSGGTVGFSLRNSSDANLFEFFFVGGGSNYTVSATNVVNQSGGAVGFQSTGLRLAFTLTDSNSFFLSIDRLGNGVGVDHTYTGDLFAGGGNQSISNFRLFNANAGSGSGNDAYFNSFVVSAVPEASAAGCVGCVLAVTAAFRIWRRKVHRLATA
jgi:hypothetical protein